ncbi:MAG: AAA family ATPase [Streptosporangiales bacterium]|nr:AAA family ATPase [Streptosporangiales bacterium]
MPPLQQAPPAGTPPHQAARPPQPPASRPAGNGPAAPGPPGAGTPPGQPPRPGRAAAPAQLPPPGQQSPPGQQGPSRQVPGRYQPPWATAPPPPKQPNPNPEPDPEPVPFDKLSHRVPHGDPWLRRVRREVVQGVGARTPEQTGRTSGWAHQLQRPVTTGRRIAIASVRGGAGKSTVSALVGAALSRHRGDRVIVVDGDPDLGSVSVRLGVEQGASLQALFASGGQPRTFEELSPYLRQSKSGLWVLSGRREIGAPPPVDVKSFGLAQPVLSRFFAVSLVDCGAGLYGELTRSVLTRVHSLVLVTPATADGVRSARQALDQLAQTFYRPLLERCVLAVVSHSAQNATDLKASMRSLSAYGVHVIHMPYDRHLAAGAAIDLGRISKGVQEFALHAGAEALLRSTWS